MTLDHFQSIDVAFGGAIADGEGQPGFDGVVVAVKGFGKTHEAFSIFQLAPISFIAIGEFTYKLVQAIQEFKVALINSKLLSIQLILEKTD